jgi:hypothetical protein
MERNKHFKSTKELLDFLRLSRKRFDASSKKEGEKLEKEMKAWEEYERSYDLELEKKKHEDYLKGIRKIIKEQKALVEKVERIMRQPESRKSLKAKKYIPLRNKSALVTDPPTHYKSKNK